MYTSTIKYVQRQSLSFMPALCHQYGILIPFNICLYEFSHSTSAACHLTGFLCTGVLRPKSSTCCCCCTHKCTRHIRVRSKNLSSHPGNGLGNPSRDRHSVNFLSRLEEPRRPLGDGREGQTACQMAGCACTVTKLI